MEYLMTYGWVILVVMVVGVTLWYFGVFRMGGVTKSMIGFDAIKPLDWRISHESYQDFVPPSKPYTVVNELVVVNAEAAVLEITSLNLSGTCSADIPVTATMAPGKETRINISNVYNGGDDIKINCSSHALGTPYSIVVKINYNKHFADGTILSKSSIGTIYGPFE